MIKELMTQGMAYHDIMDADYYHLMEILSTKKSKHKERVMTLEEFINARK